MRRILLMALFTMALTALAIAQVPKEDTKKMKPDKMNVEETIIKLDRDLFESIGRKDRTLSDRVEVANFVFINPNGGLEVRGQAMAAAVPVIDSIAPSVVAVRVYGDTAIVTGMADVKGRFADGPDITGQYRYMRVFVKEKGEWRLVAASANKIGGLSAPTSMPPKS